MTRRRSSPTLRWLQLAGTCAAVAVAGLVVTAATHLLIGGAW